MRISVLSGKGGTGKTFVSVNLAYAAENAVYMDCDVEEPNGELFINPEITEEYIVYQDLPIFDVEKCIGCRRCVEFCRFNALAYIKNRPYVFPEVCHPCGGCEMVCENDAVIYEKKKMGIIKKGNKDGIDFFSGLMDIGEASGVPLIREILDKVSKNRTDDFQKIEIVDCPPGSGCMVMESIMESDICIIVAEPTEYGRHNMEMVYNLTKIFGKKVAVILNKCYEKENPSEEYCKENNIEIIGKIPFLRETGKAVSQGKVMYLESDFIKKEFDEIMKKIIIKVSKQEVTV